MSEFPQAPLGVLCHFQAGGTPTSTNYAYWVESGEEGIPWVSIADMSGTNLVESTAKGLSDEGMAALGIPLAPAGTVLFAMYASVGKVSTLGISAVWNQALLGLTPDRKRLESRFLAYALKTLEPILPLYFRSNTQDNLSAEVVKKLRIPFPPLETQQRIADYLDRETAEIDATVADLDRYVGLLEKRRAALVADTLSRFARPGSSNTPGSPGANLGRVGLVSSLIRRGISPSYVDDGIPVVSQKCVRPGGKIDYEVCRFHDPKARSISESLFIREGDVLINSTGTGTLGRSSVAREVDRETTWDSHVTLVRPNLDDVNPGYLGWVIANQESKLIKLSVGSTNQIELSRDTVINLEIPLPSLGDQKRIADYLDRETIVIDDLIAESTRLRDLLLKRRSVLITEVVTGRKQV